MYQIEFSKEARKRIKKYKKSNTVIFNKLVLLLEELMDHPRTGTGHPEPLKFGDSIIYSRRLSAKDRLIYEIYDDKVVVYVVTVDGHYDDK